LKEIATLVKELCNYESEERERQAKMCSVSNKLRIGLSFANRVFIYILGRQTDLVRLVP
jgi:hypothetical protein